MPDRTIIVPAPLMGQLDAELRIESRDGETASMSLVWADRVLAMGEDFRRPSFTRWTWWDAPGGEVAGTFGAFLSHAFESSEEDARDGWPILEDDAAEWCDALALMEEEPVYCGGCGCTHRPTCDERPVDRCEACGSDRGDGYCQECPDDPSRAYDARQ